MHNAWALAIRILCTLTEFYTEAKLHFEDTCENTTKKQLYQAKKNKAEISPDLARTRLTLNNRQTLVTNKASTFAKNFLMRFSKSGTKFI